MYIGFGNRTLLFFSFPHMKRKKKLLQASIDDIAAIAQLFARLRSMYSMYTVHASVVYYLPTTVLTGYGQTCAYCTVGTTRGICTLYLLPVTCTLYAVPGMGIHTMLMRMMT